jgi:mono/diheme cytochrome c family protein
VKDPAELVPGDPEAHFNEEPIAPSGMPFFNLSSEDADALTTYILSFRKDRIPSTVVVPSDPRPTPVYKTAIERGRAVYVKYGCAGCHAPDGSGGIRNFNYQNVTEPNLKKVIGTYTRDELREKIGKGVSPVAKADPKGPTPPLYMPGWKEKIQGDEMEDLMTYLFSIGEKTEEW